MKKITYLLFIVVIQSLCFAQSAVQPYFKMGASFSTSPPPFNSLTLNYQYFPDQPLTSQSQFGNSNYVYGMFYVNHNNPSSYNQTDISMYCNQSQSQPYFLYKWVTANGGTFNFNQDFDIVQTYNANVKLIPSYPVTNFSSYYLVKMRLTDDTISKAIVHRLYSLDYIDDFTNNITTQPSSSNVALNTPVTINIETFYGDIANPNYYYLKYSKDNWQTYSLVPMSVNSTTRIATATIPGFSSPQQKVSYMFLFAKTNLLQLSSSEDINLYSLGVRYNPSDFYSVGSSTQSYTNVTFRVNLSSENVGINNVAVSGSFNNWSTTSNYMQSVGNNIYETTIPLLSNTTYSYKFTIGNTYEVPTGSCVVDDGFGNLNRTFNTTATNNLVLPTVCFSSCNNCASQATVLVEFTVDMSNEIVSSNGVFLAGSFNGFSTTANPMTMISNGIYKTQIALNTNSVYSYKFVNGTEYEIPPTSCTINDGNGNYNRQVSVSNSNLNLSTSCFNSCNVCQPITTKNVTFRVNMNGYNSNAGVYLSGSFNGFSATANAMNGVGNGIYELTLPLNPNATYTYKFVNGSTYEILPTSCSQDDGIGNFNRFFSLQNNDLLLPLVCFNSCSNCTNTPITFNVDMSQTVVSPQGVFVAGSFNGFNTTQYQMTHLGNNLYSKTIDLPTGSNITYKFLNGSNYELIDSICGVMGSASVYDRAFNMNENVTSLPVVCFGQCSSCPINDLKQVTFRVNAAGQNTTNGVFLAGSFNNFSTTATPMNHLGNGIYQIELSLLPYATYTYKFVVNSVFELVPTNCTQNDGQGNYNRFVTVGNTNLYLPLVCFNECLNCSSTLVTFRIDMSQETVSAQGVFVAGSFNGFNTTQHQLTNTGNNIYQKTISIPSNTQITYKFLNGSNYELIDSACGVMGSASVYDRNYWVGSNSNIIPLACFNQCSTCPQILNRNVVFKVNMIGQNVSNGVYLAGSFNNFSTTANPMTPIGNDVYELTLNLPNNSTYLYKFVNDSAFEIIPNGCTQNDGNGNFNRFFYLSNTNLNLPVVCFNSCSDCITVPITFNVDMNQLPVSQQGIFVAGNFNNFNTTQHQLVNVGANVFSKTINVLPSQQLLFRYYNGSNFETVNTSCATFSNNSYYRTFSVQSSAINLESVCYEQCSECVTTKLNSKQIKQTAFFVHPNIISSNINIEVKSFKNLNGELLIVDVLGNIIYQTLLNTVNRDTNFLLDFNAASASNGTYYVVLKSSEGNQYEKIVIQH